MALLRLRNEYKEYLKEPNCMYSLEPNSNNFFEWNILLFGPSNTMFEGGIFKCNLLFTKEYPNKAPIFKFITQFPHPNIYKDGKICISILHNGEDEFEYEDISERWNPSHSVNSIILSIISLLIEPNLNSPADLDASLLWKTDMKKYKELIYSIIAKDI
jgi:ubiquitin-protein ligase